MQDNEDKPLYLSNLTVLSDWKDFKSVQLIIRLWTDINIFIKWQLTITSLIPLNYSCQNNSTSRLASDKATGRKMTTNSCRVQRVKLYSLCLVWWLSYVSALPFSMLSWSLKDGQRRMRSCSRFLLKMTIPSLRTTKSHTWGHCRSMRVSGLSYGVTSHLSLSTSFQF